MSIFHIYIGLADVDISPNPNPFKFCTSESEFIKKTGIRIHFFKIEGILEAIGEYQVITICLEIVTC